MYGGTEVIKSYIPIIHSWLKSFIYLSSIFKTEFIEKADFKKEIKITYKEPMIKRLFTLNSKAHKDPDTEFLYVYKKNNKNLTFGFDFVRLFGIIIYLIMVGIIVTCILYIMKKPQIKRKITFNLNKL